MSAELTESQAALRRAFTSYPRGVVAVAANVDGEPTGMAVSAFLSLSLDPPLMVICIDRGSSTWPKLATASELGISVLSEEQAWLGRQLAGPAKERFVGADFREAPSGALLAGGAVACFTARIRETHPGGDHTMVVLDVVDYDADPEIPPLLWHRGKFAAVAATAHRASPAAAAS
ncbi:flavin reductase family protein [Ruicaihuangia caeni]|uniref:Flavin reductase family protein n=1 Tax=Ruicaihuangia caeni TaxID=3042517 RepID=A0AAW6TC20_9MICO|nr:flavin reductase family protein [Klugiella sp. YN-L-19]MDI2099147.1 flavin reductase family protein [Klugiella sp. YN-L-19]